MGRTVTIPPRRAWILSTVATVSIAAIVLLCVLLAGQTAAVPAVLGTIAMLPLALRRAALRTRAVFALIIALTAATAVAVGPSLLWLPLLVAGSVILTVPFTARFGAVALAVPIVPAVLGSVTVDLTPLNTGVVVAVAAAAITLVAFALKIELGREPLPFSLAWGHAVVVALLAAIAVAIEIWQQWGHGYWVVIGLAMALSPVHATARAEIWIRVLGTALGAIAAIALAIVLPPWVLLIAGAIALVAGIAYSLVGRRVEMVALQTIMVVAAAAVSSTESSTEIALLRFLFVVAGAALALLGSEAILPLERAAQARRERDTV